MAVRFRSWAALLLAMMFLVTFGGRVAWAEPTEGTKIADQTFPAVHLVTDTWTVTASVPTLQVSEDAMANLETQLRRQLESGVLAPDIGALQEAIVNAIAESPGTYLVPTGSLRTTDAEIGARGTSWTVTPDGYMVTAAHVVSKSDEELAQGVSLNALETFLEEDIKALQNTENPFTDAQLEKLADAISKVYAANMQLSDVRHKVTVRLSEPDPAGGGKIGRDVDAEIIDQGEGYPEADWAIIKVNGRNMPTIPLGDSSEMVAGSPIYVVGYPGASTFFPKASLDSENQPTITQGSVTSVKSTEDNVPYFQSQAPATNGNSGGPAFNSEGKAVGVLVATSLDPRTKAQLDGQVWVLQGSVVEEKLKKHDVKVEESDTTKAYNEGLDLFYKEWYGAALEKFEETKDLYSTHPYVDGFIDKAKKAIDEGKDKTPEEPEEEANQGGGIPVWLWIVIGVVALAAVGLIGYGIAANRKGRKKQLGAGSGQPPQQQWPMGPGAPPQPPSQPPPWADGQQAGSGWGQPGPASSQPPQPNVQSSPPQSAWPPAPQQPPQPWGQPPAGSGPSSWPPQKGPSGW